MNKEKLKNILKYSVIFGAILGVLAVIPIIRVLAFLIMSTCASVFIILYMQKKQQIGDLTIKGSAIIGALIGFVNLFGFLVIFLPLNTILGALPIKFIAEFYALSQFLLSLWWLWLIMGGLITALFNSFALLSFFYVRDTYFMIEGKKEVRPNFNQREKK